MNTASDPGKKASGMWDFRRDRSGQKWPLWLHTLGMDLLSLGPHPSPTTTTLQSRTAAASLPGDPEPPTHP